LGYYVSIDSLNERTPTGISIETLFHFVKQVYVLLNFVIHFYINKSGIPIMTFCHSFFIYTNELLNYSISYKKLSSNMQSTDSLRELNAKLLAKIAKLRKENAEIPELREKLLIFAKIEAENAKLKQIIEENARRDFENAELKSRVRELEARLALLEQGSAVDGMALSFGQIQNGKEAMPVVMVSTVNIPDFVINQLNNEVG
jgi:hypothetical protein